MDRTDVYLSLFKYWLKIFALAFGMGVVSGIVMSYQFGTNWCGVLRQGRAGIGPLMAYEVLTAFFLEAGFLGIMLFGINRVGGGCISPRPAWWLSAPDLGVLDSLGQQLDADAGRLRHERGRAVRIRPTGGRSSSIRPSPTASYTWCSPPISRPPWRSARSAPGTCCGTATTMVRGSCSRWRCGWRRSCADPDPRRRPARPQYARTPAGQGRGDGGPFREPPNGAPLILFGIPDQAGGQARNAIQIPKLVSLILKHDLNAPIERPRHPGRPSTGPTCHRVLVTSASWWGWASSCSGSVLSEPRSRFRGTLYDGAAAPRFAWSWDRRASSR